MAYNTLSYLTDPGIRPSLYGAWGLAIVLTVIVMFYTGQISTSSEAKDLLASVQSSSLYYGSAIVGSSATVLALTLTILSLTGVSDKKEDKIVFTSLHAIAALCVYAFIGAVILLLLISFPVGDFEKLPQEWFSYIYYLICIWNGMLAANAISIMLILRHVVIRMIGEISPSYDDEGNERK